MLYNRKHMALLICFIAKRQFGMPINYLIQDRHLSIQMIVNVVCISSSVESHMCRLIVCCLTHTLLALFSCFLSCLIRSKQIIIKPQSVHLCGVFEAFQILLPQTRNMKYLIENTYQIIRFSVICAKQDKKYKFHTKAISTVIFQNQPS